MFVGTLNNLGDSKEARQSINQIRVSRRPFRVSAPSMAYESVPEVATDVAYSGAQPGSVSETWLVMLSMVN